MEEFNLDQERKNPLILTWEEFSYMGKLRGGEFLRWMEENKINFNDDIKVIGEDGIKRDMCTAEGDFGTILMNEDDNKRAEENLRKIIESDKK